MKKMQLRFAAFGVVALAALSQTAPAQSVVYNEAWAGTVDGWGVASPWSIIGTSAAAESSTVGGGGLTMSASGNPGYGFSVGSTASTTITTDLINAQSVSVDITSQPGPAFGYYLQFDLTLNNSVAGYSSVDGYTYQAVTLGGITTLTWSGATLSSSYLSQLAANPSSTTSLNLQIGGGGAGEITLDHFEITDASPEPSSTALFALGAAGMWTVVRRRNP